MKYSTLSGTSVLCGDDKPDDGDGRSAPSTPTTTTAGRVQTTRGPRRKKVGEAIQERKFFSPEFMPPFGRRSKLKDYLERNDCYTRRNVLEVPEFYPGTVLSWDHFMYPFNQ